MRNPLINFMLATALFWALVLTLFVISYASVEDIAKDPDTFAVCKTVDLASTAVILQHGGTELNPVMKALFAHGWILPIGISVGLWYWIKEAHDDKTTEIVNAVTCGVAAHNILVM